MIKEHNIDRNKYRESPTFLGDPMKKSASISACGLYRYDLTRMWSAESYVDAALCAFIGLNPSTADADLDDPTIRRCIGYAKDWGYDGLVMLNAYAYRATDPRAMKSASDPVGLLNDDYIDYWSMRCPMIVACWGVHIDDLRERDLRDKLPRLHFLRLTKSGKPGHPLYLPKSLTPQPWEG